MTTTEATARSAMKLALEAMENMSTALREDDVLGNDIDMLLDAITALTEQSNLKQVIELYDSPDQPAQRQARSADTWVSLTDEQVIKTFNAICNGKPFDVERILELHRAIEAELKAKNSL